jgi:hypothetical protein
MTDIKNRAKKTNQLLNCTLNDARLKNKPETNKTTHASKETNKPDPIQARLKTKYIKLSLLLTNYIYILLTILTSILAKKYRLIFY